MWFNIAGELYVTKTPMRVTADSIAGNFDFIPVDGTMPVDRFAQAMLWKELLGLVASGKMIDPMTGRPPNIDLMNMLKHVAFLSGVKNFSQFEVRVVPDQQIAARAQAGNLVPMGGPGGGGDREGANSGAAGTGTSRDLTQIPQSGSSRGVGRAA
jgi:hypothetical protein